MNVHSSENIWCRKFKLQAALYENKRKGDKKMVHITDASMQKFEKEHIAKVREVAPECAILLKSNGDFPLDAAGKIALFGSGARRTIKGGTGSGDVNVRAYTTVEQGLENAGFEVVSKAWLDAYEEHMTKTRKEWITAMKAEAAAAGINGVMYCMGKVMPETAYEFSLESDADIAIYVLARNSGEGADRTMVAGDINLTETEIRDILALQKQYDKFLLVLNVGGMVDLTPVNTVENILLLGQLGTPTGDVLADLVLGKSYPSGKLAMTWAPIAEYPSTEGFGDPDDTYYREGIYVGYRYFDTVGKEVTYPFGYGLSYTTFAVETKDIVADEKQVTVTAQVINTGKCAGKEVVQVYASLPEGDLDQPYQKLVGYAKTKKVAAGESTEVSVTFATQTLASFSEKDSAYIMEAGEYVIRLGSHSRDTMVAGILTLDDKAVLEKTKHICEGWGFDDLVPEKVAFNPDGEEEQKEAAKHIALSAAKFETATYTYPEVAAEIPEGQTFDFAEVLSGKKTLEEFVAGLSDKQLAYLAIGNYKDVPEGAGAESVIGAAGSHVAGAAGESTSRLEDLGVGGLYMADGPAGLRLATSYKIVDGEIKGNANAFANFMEFMGEEELEMMASMAPKPSEAELAAPENYQYCIAIPIGTALAQAWNDDVAEICGDMVGQEMEMFGVHLWLAPAQNIQRSPLCGRNFEYYSEEPIVSGRTSAAVTRGVQKHPGCGVTIKHFACNNQETNRFLSNSVVSERALREIYLKGFEICVRSAKPEAIMSSYNLVNGEHTCNSKDIQTHVLRNEWGHEGIVMTDWFVTGGMGNGAEHRDNKYETGSAAGCVKAGNNITMPGGSSDLADILDALTNKEHAYALTKAELQQNAMTVLKEVIKLRK